MSASGSRRSTSPEETTAFGEELGAQLPQNSILALFGDLGAGKTTLIHGLVKGFIGQTCAVCSPTYTYLNIYAEQVFHFDLYRLAEARAFFEMGFEEFFEAGGLTCIEWSERIEKHLPSHAIRLHLTHQGGEERWLTFATSAS